MGKYEGPLFVPNLTICPHARTRSLASPRQDKTSQGQVWLAWHGMVWYGVLVRYHMIG